MKIAPSELQMGRRTRRSEPIILFSIAGQMFAINANAIHEIRSMDSISGAATEISPPVVPKVRHLLHRGKSVFFVVDGCAHFGLPASQVEHVMLLRNSRIALLVKSIDRMSAMSVLVALPPGFSGPERRWYRGLTLISGDVVPVISPSGFLSEQELALLRPIAGEAEGKMPRAPEVADLLPLEPSQ